MLDTLIEVMISQVYAYIQTHPIVCMKCTFLIYQLHFNKAGELSYMILSSVNL